MSMACLALRVDYWSYNNSVANYSEIIQAARCSRDHKLNAWPTCKGSIIFLHLDLVDLLLRKRTELCNFPVKFIAGILSYPYKLKFWKCL